MIQKENAKKVTEKRRKLLQSLTKRLTQCITDCRNVKKRVVRNPRQDSVKKQEKQWNSFNSPLKRRRGESLLSVGRISCTETKKEPKERDGEIFVGQQVLLPRQEIQGECSICWNAILTASDEYMLHCGHSFCYNCLNTICIMKSESSTVLELGCPWTDCEYLLDDDEIRDLVGNDAFDDYREVKMFAIKLRNPQSRFCPTPDCTELMDYGTPNEPLVCRTCKQEYCFLCMNPWHNGTTCEHLKDENVKQFEEWIDENAAKPCPQCKVGIQLSEGKESTLHESTKQN